MEYRYTMEYYLVIKKNEIIPFVGKWMELELIMLSEVKQTKKQILHILSPMWSLVLKKER
jgi:hypothetical protein